MPEILQDVPLCIETCHNLLNVTNKKQTKKERAVLNVVQAFHTDVPECPISADFFAIYTSISFLIFAQK
jgi:hypothetical protein